MVLLASVLSPLATHACVPACQVDIASGRHQPACVTWIMCMAQPTPCPLLLLQGINIQSRSTNQYKQFTQGGVSSQNNQNVNTGSSKTRQPGWVWVCWVMSTFVLLLLEIHNFTIESQNQPGCKRPSRSPSPTISSTAKATLTHGTEGLPLHDVWTLAGTMTLTLLWAARSIQDSPVPIQRLTCRSPSLPHAPSDNARQDLDNAPLAVAIPFLPMSPSHLRTDEEPFCFHFTDGKGETWRGWVICPGWCSKSMEQKGIGPLHAVKECL